MCCGGAALCATRIHALIIDTMIEIDYYLPVFNERTLRQCPNELEIAFS